MIDKLPADANLFAGSTIVDTDHHPYVVSAVTGDKGPLQIHILSSVISVVHEVLKKEITHSNVFLDSNLLDGDVNDEARGGDGKEDDGDDDEPDDENSDDDVVHKEGEDDTDRIILGRLKNLFDEASSKSIIDRTTAYIAGYCAERACNLGCLNRVGASALRATLLTDLSTAKVGDVPVALIEERMGQRTGTAAVIPIPSPLLYGMVRALERDIFTPLLSNVQVISCFGDDIVDYVRDQIDAHEMVNNIVDTVRSSLQAGGCEDDEVVSSVVEKFFEVLTNVVLADYERFVRRKRKDSCHMKRMLAFRADVLTRRAAKVDY
jgi:hypothetical protein